MKNFSELIEKAQSQTIKKTVVVIAAHDEHTLEAVDMVFKSNVAIPVLIGNVKKINELIKSRGYNLNKVEMIEENDEKEAAKKGVLMARQGVADFIMKGKLQTADLLKTVVNKESGLQMEGIMSHFGIFEIPTYHKLLVVTDGGMIPYPDVNEKTEILRNAVRTLCALGYKSPKVAVLASTELVNPKLQESVDGDILKKLNQDGKIKDCIVEGPISYDLMISHESAAIKEYSSPVTGETDILLMPNMTSGNLLAKSYQFSSGAKMAGMIVGASVPIVLVSRGATAEEKYLSLVLSAAMAQKTKGEM